MGRVPTAPPTPDEGNPCKRQPSRQRGQRLKTQAKSHTMRHTLQALRGIQFPILQAPMAGAQGSALALAVTQAGGLGSLPAATISL